VWQTARATADLDDIWFYIAKDSVSVADRLIDRITERCHGLADHPYLGAARPDMAPEARVLTIGDYLVLYRIIAAAAEVVRIAHGARRLDGLFDET